MKTSDTARVLARIAAVDQRTIGHADIAAWHETIGHLDYADAMEAVRRFFAAHAERRILPADVITGAKSIRATRLSRTLEPAPADPDDVDAYIRQLRHGRARIAAPAPEGTPAITSPHRRGGVPPQSARDALEEARRACADASARGGDRDGVEADALRRAQAEKRTPGRAPRRATAAEMRAVVEQANTGEAQ